MTVEDASNDRRSPVKVFIDAVKGMTITPFVRVICLIMSISYVFLAWDPLFHPDSEAYERPIFDAVFAFASPLAWGLVFAACAILLQLAAITSRAAIYVAAISFSAITLAGWASMVIYQSWRTPLDDLTSGAYGLYIGTFVAVVGLACSPRQLTAVRPIIAVLEEGNVRPLKRAG